MRNTESQLLAAIERFDGRSLDHLRRISQRMEMTKNDIGLILDQTQNGSSNARVAASWILLNSESALNHIDSQCLKRLLNALSQQNAWQASLHILQLLHKVDLPVDLSQDLYPVLIELSQSSKPFLRAWAISALLHLPELNLQQRNGIQTLAKTALSEDSPSVKARIRKALGTTQLS